MKIYKAWVEHIPHDNRKTATILKNKLNEMLYHIGIYNIISINVQQEQSFGYDIIMEVDTNE